MIDKNGELLKLCTKHKEYFPNEYEWIPCTEEYFSKTSSSKDGLTTYCKRCNSKKTYINHLKDENKTKKDKSDWYLKNKERIIKDKKAYAKSHPHVKKVQALWRKNNPDKLKEYNQKYSNKKHKITSKEWLACKSYFNYECAYCGFDEESHKEKYNQQLHKEHADDKGSDGLDNCITSCKSCNSSKHTDNLEEWYKQQKFFTQERLDKIHSWLNEDYEQYIVKER